MSSLRPQDRKSLCRFTFADGRQCRTPRSRNHPHFCCDHARKESQACAADKLAHELAYFFSGEYLSACDLSAALGTDSWREAVRNSVHQNFDYRNDSPEPEPPPTPPQAPLQSPTPLESTLIEIPVSVYSKPL